jgi:prolipoprotein diacylglyceryltransferase
VPLASIPSPGRAVWHLGPLSVRAYALCVIAGIIVAVAVASRRYRHCGGRALARRGVILDVAAWAIPFGLAGALVHAILLDNRHAFGDEYRLWHAATIGVAAIGVPGAVALGAAGAWIACRRSGVAFGPVAGAVAPALAFGLAVAGLGNWWAQQF